MTVVNSPLTAKQLLTALVLRLTDIFTRLSVTDRRSILSADFKKGYIYIVILGIFESENAHGFCHFFQKFPQRRQLCQVFYSVMYDTHFLCVYCLLPSEYFMFWYTGTPRRFSRAFRTYIYDPYHPSLQ
jgi:hypothetical protein